MKDGSHLRFCFLCAALTLLGCGDSAEPRQPIFGKVTASSGVIENGLLTLFPLGENAGPVAMTEITHGEFRFTTENGPYPGKHRVVVDFQCDPPLGRMTMPAGTPDIKRGFATPTTGEQVVKRPPWETECVIPQGGELRKDFEIPNPVEVPGE